VYFDDGNTTTPTGLPLNATVNGTILLVTNNATYRLPVIIGNTTRQTHFDNLCNQTCTMNATNGTLHITTTGDATIHLTSINVATTAPNRPPVLAVEFGTLVIQNTTTVNLSAHIIDPDGDALYYSVGSSSLVNASINGALLTLTPLQEGNGTISVYASDLHDLIPIGVDISVPLPPAGTAPVVTPPVNATENTTPAPVDNTTNRTADDNTIAPNTTIPSNTTTVGPDNATPSNTTSLDCSNRNPNLRPIECLQAQASRYFTEPDKYWENNERERVARVNALGNLVINGTLHQNATGSPGSGDFVLGTNDENGTLIPTIWVSTTTGSLYLRGSLHEEVINMNPAPGMYAIVTRRSIYLVLADTTTGDLYLRGDLITGHEVIQ
jgi:hypothetical protein